MGSSSCSRCGRALRLSGLVLGGWMVWCGRPAGPVHGGDGGTSRLRTRSRSGCSMVSVLPRRGAPNLSWVRGAPASGEREGQRE
ncbi:hypothetical protein HMPREF9057_02743 [Actinomyces sp. oral taxon 171 str. F0337]|nr:hypothetical protein HMPREF9057_02743 [Actinomyces sp. oral taxon 171 str. F0337]